MKTAILTQLQVLFVSQITRLQTMGYPNSILDVLRAKETALISAVESLTLADDCLPFVPVIPEKTLGYRDQVSLISGLPYLKSYLDVNGRRHQLLDPLRGTSIPTFSREPYYIIDVITARDGAPSGYVKINHEEGMAIAVHMNMASRKIGATACAWEGQEVAVISRATYCNGQYPVADWEMLNDNVAVYYCRSKVF